jgi:ATP-binding cassette subfamily F protein 3
MAIVTTHNLGKSFGALDVFAGLSLSVPHGARIAIVGPNGIGKTTLLRIVAGKESASAGTIRRSKGLTIGYLPQESVVESPNTLWEECLLPFRDLLGLQQEMARLEAKMASEGRRPEAENAREQSGAACVTGAEARERTHDSPSAMGAEDTVDRYGTVQAKFEHGGGYTYETRIRQVLTGLGFRPDEYALPLTHLSGGQRTRALLARLLLESPTLLILDEPTNHLDTAAVEWLESYIRDWDGAILVVSHDRYLLDKVCNNVWEMSRAGVETYRGNYSHYLTQRQERWELRSKEFEAEKERLLNEMDYIKRNIAAQNVSQARGRLRRMSRQIQAIEQVGLEAMRGKKWLQVSQDVQIQAGVMTPEEAESRLRALRNPLQHPTELKLRLGAAKRGGNMVLRTRDLAIGYPGNFLFSVPDIELQRLGCVALIGPNGAGKTTFLKVLLGQQPPLRGEVQLGASLDVGYFAQAHENLDPEKDLIQEISAAAPDMLVAEIRSHLARYLFTGEDVFKKVRVLSGGERGRLALAKLALGNSNLLLLDEPTNHLDIPSQEVLQNVLAEFEGTVILVSHDRYLIDALATQVWEIDKEKGVLSVFRGTYTEYHTRKDAAAAPGAASEAERAQRGGAFKKARAAKNREIAEERRAREAELKRQKRLTEVEARIAFLEGEIARLRENLACPPADRDEIHRLAEEYMRTEEEMETMVEEWGRLQE